MPTTVSQLAARIEPGTPVQRRQRRRMKQLRKHARQQMAFEAHMRKAHSKKRQQPVATPPIVAKPNDETERPPLEPSAALRNTWRRGFMHGVKHIQSAHRGLSQSRMGWVQARLGRALTDNPYMAEKDIEKMVDALVKNVPTYGDEDQ